MEKRAKAWEAGAVGEQATGEVLSRLDPAIWTVWHDVRWPGRKRANIDHVVVGPPGVFVIDSKNWSGQLTVADGVLKQNGHPRESTVAGAAEASLAVFQLVPDVPVHPVMCFLRDESLTGWIRDVMLCSTNNLDLLIQTRPHVLTPDQVGLLATRLETALQAAGSSAGTSRAAARRPLSGTPVRRANRRRPSLLRPLVGAGLALAFAGALMSGLTTPAVDWVSRQIVEGVTPDPLSPADEEKQPGKKQKDRQRERQK
ncbi:nuclease-related domain-containing protein [Nocardioides aestuarii]|uniref:Nuclease-related domain-containing protein n=1 Tax=Nocardioides aestuarii TaxID=252231 RepID=A0ABW4TPD0_9ACTN